MPYYPILLIHFYPPCIWYLHVSLGTGSCDTWSL